MIKLFNVFMADDVGDFVLPVLKSGYIGEGEKVKEFERTFGDFIGNRDVVAVNSGTSAIQMALRLAGVGEGDHVISTPMTCLATNEPILALGAKPIWADVDATTGNIIPASIEQILELWNAEGVLDIKAILCVHWGGYPCDISDIYEIASKYEIPVIEDAAHALGSIYGGSIVGIWADFACFSFQAIKPLTTVDGGALVTINDGALKRARLMRWFGLDREKGAAMRCSQDPPEYGYKFQMNDVSAAIGIANIRHLQVNLDIVFNNAGRYSDAFTGLSDVKIAPCRLLDKPSYWLYTVLVEDSGRFIAYMRNYGVECSKVHGRNDKKKIFADSAVELPGVDEFDRKHVCIPVGWWLTDDDVSLVIDLVRRYRS